MLLLGDILYHGPRNDLPREYAPKQVIPMLGAWAEKILCVRGNCEAEVDQMVLNFPCLSEYSQLMADGKLFYLTHGHHKNPQDLPVLPEGSIFLYGHTHVAEVDREENGMWVMNPGTAGYGGGSAGLIETDGKTILSCRIITGENLEEFV